MLDLVRLPQIATGQCAGQGPAVESTCKSCRKLGQGQADLHGRTSKAKLKGYVACLQLTSSKAG